MSKLILFMYNFAKLFHQATNFACPVRLLDEWPLEWTTTFYKEYRQVPSLKLPPPDVPDNANLWSTLERRRSARAFKNTKHLNAKELSNLLHYSCGLIANDADGGKTLRPYPSAGARYPLEVYVVARAVKDIPSGIYHYHLPTHRLSLIRQPAFIEEILNSFSPIMDYAKAEAGSFLIISSVFNRIFNKYGERGYRYLLEEVGAMTQNIYLVATALNLPIVTFAGFEDEQVNEVLDFDGVEESVVAIIALGGVANTD